MLKPVIAAAALVAIAGSSFVYAQQGFGGRDGRSFNSDDQRTEFRHEFRHGLSSADVAAFTDARIAAMKAGLELTPDQAKSWPAFEQAVRDMAQLRIDRIKAREAADQQLQSQQQPSQQQQMSPFDRMARRADNMSKRSAALKKVADAGAPLYQSLDDAQKGRFTVLARMLRPHMHPGFRGWRRFGEGYGRGFGGEGRGDRMLDRDNGGHMQKLGNDGDEGSRL
jgi:LTXXQ motif family protein